MDSRQRRLLAWLEEPVNQELVLGAMLAMAVADEGIEFWDCLERVFKVFKGTLGD